LPDANFNFHFAGLEPNVAVAIRAQKGVNEAAKDGTNRDGFIFPAAATTYTGFALFAISNLDESSSLNAFDDALVKKAWEGTKTQYRTMVRLSCAFTLCDSAPSALAVSHFCREVAAIPPVF
jgi:hypothetical protein